MEAAVGLDEEVVANMDEEVVTGMNEEVVVGMNEQVIASMDEEMVNANASRDMFEESVNEESLSALTSRSWRCHSNCFGALDLGGKFQ